MIHVEIPLTNGGVTLVSARDLGLVGGLQWYKSKGRGTYYVRVHLPGSGKPGKKLYLHRLILDFPPMVDHIDRNGLNNTRENLRAVTHSENNANAKLYSNNKTGYRGVHIGGNGKYQAFISSKYLGTYNTREEASTAYNSAKRRKYK